MFVLEPNANKALELVTVNKQVSNNKMKRILDLPNNYKQIEIIQDKKDAKMLIPKITAVLNDSHKFKTKAAKINLKKWRQYLKDREGGANSRFKYKNKLEVDQD